MDRAVKKAKLLSSKLRSKIIRKKKPLVQKLLAWSTSNSAVFPWRKTVNPYHILVAEMLLRKTRANQVKNVYETFTREFPSLDVLYYADIKKVHKIVSTLGLNYRSRWIKDISRNLYEKYGNTIPSNRYNLRSALGTKSEYLFSAIRCFAFGENTAVFDVNVKRILERVFSIEFGNHPHKDPNAWHIASLLVPDDLSKEYNWAMLDLGRMVCTANNPRCEVCPLNDICDFAKLNYRLEKRPSTQ